MEVVLVNAYPSSQASFVSSNHLVALQLAANYAKMVGTSMEQLLPTTADAFALPSLQVLPVQRKTSAKMEQMENPAKIKVQQEV